MSITIPGIFVGPGRVRLYVEDCEAIVSDDGRTASIPGWAFQAIVKPVVKIEPWRATAEQAPDVHRSEHGGIMVSRASLAGISETVSLTPKVVKLIDDWAAEHP